MKTSATTIQDLPARPTAELLKLAGPIIGMTLSRLAMTFIDFVMVSRLGTDAQAAISPATIFVFAASCLGLGMAQSVQTFVSQADGRNEPHRAGSYLWQTLYIAIFFCALAAPFTLTAGIWFGGICNWVGCPQSVTAMQVDYVRIALWMMGPAILCAGLQGFFNGLQRPLVPLLAVIVSLAVNFVGNWLLIFGKLGAPEMGIAGAAVSTVLAWSVRAVIMFAAVLPAKMESRYRTRSAFAFDYRKTLEIARVGGPMSIHWLIEIGAFWAFLNVIVPQLGDEHVMAASNIAVQIMHVGFMPAIGIGIALSSQVGFAIGRGRPDLARLRARVAFRLAGGYMALIGLVFLLTRSTLPSLFTSDPEVLAFAAIAMLWVALFQLPDAVSIVYVNALRGAGDTRVPAVVTAIITWTVQIGCAWMLARFVPQWGLHGPWLAMTASIFGLGAFLYLRFQRGAWENIRLLDSGPRGFPVNEPPRPGPDVVHPESNGSPAVLLANEPATDLRD